MTAEDQLSKGGYNFNRHTDIRQQKILKNGDWFDEL